jgi:ribosomal protein L21E
MVKSKKVRTKGKLQLSRYFQNLSEGDRVSVVRELSVRANFPERLQGRTGTIEGKRGNSYVIKIKDSDKEKKFIIEPIHLKKIE